MLKIAALPDVHGHPEAIRRLSRAEPELDVLVLVGDVTDARADEWPPVLEAAEAAAGRVLAVPGNMDAEPVLADMRARGLSLHGTAVVVSGVAFLGVGGALPFFGPFELGEDELEAELERAGAAAPPDLPWLVACHQPPHGTALDRLRGGAHVGSRSVRAFLERHAPPVCFTGHIHEAAGTDSLGATRLVNPGPLWRTGGYAYVEVEGGEVVGLEVRRA